MRVLINEPDFHMEVKKSKFIAYAKKCDSPQMAKALVKEMWLLHPDATHVVHAAVTGPQRSVFSYSDDHEPKNTAGRPALEVVKGSGITDICVLIVRYFGGTLLGTGGLVSAYSDSTKGVIALCESSHLVPSLTLAVEVPYALRDILLHRIKDLKTEVLDQEFATEVTLTISCTKSDEKALFSLLNELRLEPVVLEDNIMKPE